MSVSVLILTFRKMKSPRWVEQTLTSHTQGNTTQKRNDTISKKRVARKISRVMSHVNESCTTYLLRHVPYEGVMSHMNVFCLIWMSHVLYWWVMYHIFIEACRIWVYSKCRQSLDLADLCLTWMSHVSYEWVLSHMYVSCPTWMCHVPYGWVMSHMDESRTIYLLRRVAYGCDKCRRSLKFADLCFI